MYDTVDEMHLFSLSSLIKTEQSAAEFSPGSTLSRREREISAASVYYGREKENAFVTNTLLHSACRFYLLYSFPFFNTDSFEESLHNMLFNFLFMLTLLALPSKALCYAYRETTVCNLDTVSSLK